ncbi:uncharacterized protein LOC144177979 [Haemaphysalis longicornis]
MKPLRHRRGALRTTITKATALDALLQNLAAPTLDSQTHLDIILDNQRALHELDSQIQPPPGIRRATPGTRFAALPTVQLLTFSGDRRDWQGFWYQYNSSIHSNATLPRIEKFKYMFSYLTGYAKDAIDSIRLADDNCDSAVSVITNRFGWKHLLVDDHLDKLLAL